jgi:hypothetical protein
MQQQQHSQQAVSETASIPPVLIQYGTDDASIFQQLLHLTKRFVQPAVDWCGLLTGGSCRSAQSCPAKYHRVSQVLILIAVRLWELFLPEPARFLEMLMNDICWRNAVGFLSSVVVRVVRYVWLPEPLHLPKFLLACAAVHVE